MSDPTTDVTVPGDEEITTPELGRTAIAGKLFAERAATLAGQVRDPLFARLLAMFRKDGTKSITISDEDGTELGAATLTAPTAKAVVFNRDVFADWVAENHPTEAKTVIEVRPEFEKALLKHLIFQPALIGADGHPVDLDTVPAGPDGEPLTVESDPEDLATVGLAVKMVAYHKKSGDYVPGVVFQPAGEPKSFSITFYAPKVGALTEEAMLDGRDRTARMLHRTGQDRLLEITDHTVIDV